MRPNDFNGHMPAETTTEVLERAVRAQVRFLPADFDPITHHKLGERWEDYSRRLAELGAEYGTEADADRIYTNQRWDQINGRSPRKIHPYPSNETILRDAREVWRERLGDPIAFLKAERERQADGVPYVMGEVLKEERDVPPTRRHPLIEDVEQAVDGLVKAAAGVERAKYVPMVQMPCPRCKTKVSQYEGTAPTGWVCAFCESLGLKPPTSAVANLRAAWEFAPTRVVLIGAPALLVLQVVLYALLGGE